MGINEQTSRGEFRPIGSRASALRGAAGGYARAGLCSLRAGRVDQGDKRRRPRRRPRPRDPRPHASLADLVGQGWQNRHLFGMLGMRIGAVRSGGPSSAAWYFIRPFMSIFGMSLIFGGILQVSPAADVPYLLFLVFGLLGFHYFQYAVYWSTLSCFGRMLRKLDFPLLPIPIAATSIALIDSPCTSPSAWGSRASTSSPTARCTFVPAPGSCWPSSGSRLCSCSRCRLGMFTSVFNAHTVTSSLGPLRPPVLVLPHARGLSARSRHRGPSADRRAESDDGADRPD